MTMAHYVNSGASTFRPWHFAETADVWNLLTGDESFDTVAKLAGLRRMMKAALYVPSADGEGFELSRAYGVVYEDSGRPVGNAKFGHVTVGEDFEVFQPDDMRDFCESLREVDDAIKYVSSGTLKGGRILWVLADLGSMLTLKRRNGVNREHRKHLFIYNPCDGSGKLVSQTTDTDVCCWNTASFALRESTPFRWSTKHTANMRDRLAQASEALGLASIGFEEQASVWQLLNGLDMGTLYQQRSNAGGMLVFASQIATGIDDGAEAVETVERASRDKGNRGSTILRAKVEALVGLFSKGIEATGTDAVDALSAVTEYIDHQHGRSAKWKTQARTLGVGMESSMIGTGAETKRRAVRLLLTRAGVRG
jgi:phage/plasmid-like protein (TIGR03299 family)